MVAGTFKSTASNVENKHLEYLKPNIIKHHNVSMLTTSFGHRLSFSTINTVVGCATHDKKLLCRLRNFEVRRYVRNLLSQLHQMAP